DVIVTFETGKRVEQRIIAIIGQSTAIKNLAFFSWSCLKLIDRAIEPVGNGVNSFSIQRARIGLPVTCRLSFISQDDGLCILEKSMQSPLVGKHCPERPPVGERIPTQGPGVSEVENIR